MCQTVMTNTPGGALPAECDEGVTDRLLHLLPLELLSNLCRAVAWHVVARRVAAWRVLAFVRSLSAFAASSIVMAYIVMAHVVVAM